MISPAGTATRYARIATRWCATIAKPWKRLCLFAEPVIRRRSRMTTMSKIAIALVVLLSSLVAHGQNSGDRAELERLLNEFLVGAGRNDAAVHDRFWADDLIYTRSAGARIGKAELMKGVRSAPAPKPEDPVTEYSAEDIQIRI